MSDYYGPAPSKRQNRGYAGRAERQDQDQGQHWHRSQPQRHRNPPPDGHGRENERFFSTDRRQETPFQAPVSMPQQQEPPPSPMEDVRISWDDWPIRQERLKGLLSQPIHERLGSFEKLPLKDQMTLFLPDIVGFEALPPQDPPSKWDDKIKGAIADLEFPVLSLFGNNDPEDSDNSGYSSDGMYAHAQKGFDKKEGVELLQRLKYCLPLTIGFLATPVICQQNTSWCYCPCGKQMGPYRQFVGLENAIKLNGPICEVSKKEPHELIKHIEAKMTSCKIHRIVFLFLSKIFDDFHAGGIRHIAFENLKTPGFKRATKAIDKKTKEIIDNYKEIAVQKQELESILEKQAKEKLELEATNKDLARKLQLEYDLKKKFKAELEAELSPQKARMAKTHYDEFRSLVHDHLREMCHTKPQSAILRVKVESSISTLFSDWYCCKDYAFLFSDFAEQPVKISSKLKFQTVSKWDVQFENTNEMDALRLPDSSAYKAKDEGGPTREFFNRVWLQIGDLSVGLPSGSKKSELQLFEQEDCGVVPKTDEKIEYELGGLDDRKMKDARAQIQSYYRAIGRLLAHCLLLSEKDEGPIPIALHVMPSLYRTVLLRGLDIEKEEYYDGDLIEHALELFGFQNGQENAANVLQERFGIGGSSDFQAVRDVIKDTYIHKRTLAICALQDGLSLQGSVRFRLGLGWLTNTMVKRIGFGQQILTPDQLFANDKLRFITFVKDAHSESLEKHIASETQKLFEQKMVQFFLEKTISSPSFVPEFVHLCTGMLYVPDLEHHPEWKIQIEYSETMPEDYLPVIHTCDKTMVIPKEAYNADMEKFEEKLLATIANTKASLFDMV